MLALAPARRAPTAWRGMLRDLPREHGPEPLVVEGRLPPALRGTLYRNGPSLFSLGGEPYVHWFDGDGAVSATHIADGQATGAVRVVETRWLAQERAAGRPLYRTYAQYGRGWRRLFALPKNPANINVMPWQGRLLALWEFGRPVELDPETLFSRGDVDLGVVRDAFSAHPHTVDGVTLNFGLRFGPRFSVDLLEMGPSPRRLANVSLRFPTLIHDFAVTRGHFVFFCPPLRLDVWGLLTGQGTFDDNLKWEPELGMEILVIPRADPSRPVRIAAPPAFLWHFVNAWEEDDTIVVDWIRYDDHTTNDWFGRAPWEEQPVPPSSYVRTRIEPEGRIQEETIHALSCEFPAIPHAEAGRPHGETFVVYFSPEAATRGGPAGLARLKDGAVDPVPLGDDTFPTEPVYVSDADGRAWVLSQVYDGASDRTFIAVIDPMRPADGPVARLWWDHHLPFTFHGAWAGR